MTSADKIFRCIFFLGALRVKHLNPLYFDGFSHISMGLPILYFKGSQVEDSELCCISVLEGCFNLSKQSRP